MGKEILLDGDEQPFLYLSSPILKAAALAELLRPGFPRESSSWDRKVSLLSQVGQLLLGDQSEDKTGLGLAHLRRRCTKTT